MNIIKPSYEIITPINYEDTLRELERIGRVCYKSEDRITADSAEKFIAMIVASGHGSVIEHSRLTVKFICDRGVTHELVRHRIASYSQESTRYCNYCKDKFGNELTFIRPYFWVNDAEKFAIWSDAMQAAENAYNALIAAGARPEEARSVLPNSLKTEIVVTMNLRQWRHFFELRTSGRAHPQIREIAVPLLRELGEKMPIFFRDLVEALPENADF